MYFQILTGLLLIFIVTDSSGQRISLKKCQEYTNLYRDEIVDSIFNTKEYSELKCPLFKSDTTVAGGREAFPYEFPSMASLLIKNGNGDWFAFCGGTLISEDFVLTAAHCLLKNSPAKISLGEINLIPSRIATKRRDVGVSRVIIHPDYKPPSSYNDIALLKLDKKITFSYSDRPSIRPACLAQGPISPGTKTSAAGWGRTSAFGDVADTLQVVDIPVKDRSECSDFFRDAIDFSTKFPGVQNKEDWLIPETNICAGKEGKDTCQGDSGGPLFLTGNRKLPCVNYVAGITSFGDIHCGSSTPGVYTKVSSYLDWIESHVWPNNN